MAETTYTPTYKQKYLNEVRPHLIKKFDLKSMMEAPKIEKITLNIGLGNAKNDSKALQAALDELMLITGQKPIVTKEKKDVVGNLPLHEYKEKIEPENGQLIIWPSHVLHEVPKQLCDHERIMIAGDVLFDRWA